eukprot:COSAG02_NODE_1493_length_12330_cov_3.681710_1_plen_120_part_00
MERRVYNHHHLRVTDVAHGRQVPEHRRAGTQRTPLRVVDNLSRQGRAGDKPGAGAQAQRGGLRSRADGPLPRQAAHAPVPFQDTPVTSSRDLDADTSALNALLTVDTAHAGGTCLCSPK